MKKKVAVLLSGSGRTLKNLIAAFGQEISVGPVISSRKKARGVSVAVEHGLTAYIVPRSSYETDESFSADINTIIRDHQPDLILLAGFLSFWHYPEEYESRIINIHPALIPAFSGKGYYGMNVHNAVYEKGVKVTGCTVHFVDRLYDHGPIILQKWCPVEDDDTPESISKKVFELECQAYPEAVRLILDDRLRRRGQRILIQKADVKNDAF